MKMVDASCLYCRQRIVVAPRDPDPMPCEEITPPGGTETYYGFHECPSEHPDTIWLRARILHFRAICRDLARGPISR